MILHVLLQYKKHNLSDNWTSKNLENGFEWCGGMHRKTIGIWIWSEIFVYDNCAGGKKKAIVLMDTQGLFDNKTDTMGCISIFAISMLLSSVQCFNVMQQVQEDDLNNLQLFTEYARLATTRGDKKPFQKLLFIVRDWQNLCDHKFGLCKDYADYVLAKEDIQNAKMRELRDAIKNSFDEINAFLMPYPGKDVAQQRMDTSTIPIVEPDFIDCVKKLADELLLPVKLVSKEIGGRPLQTHEFPEYLKQYVELFSGTELPQPISMLQVNLNLFIQIAHNVNVCFHYNTRLRQKHIFGYAAMNA